MEISFTDSIKAELLVLIPVLYALGEWIKSSKIANKFIPLILGGVSVALSLIYVLPTSDLSGGWRGVMLSVFTAITQGILCAAASVYANQMLKQLIKSGSNEENSKLEVNVKYENKTETKK